MPEFIHFKSISEVHRVCGLAKPLHPLISIVRKWPPMDSHELRISSELYLASMKGRINASHFKYGRGKYDFEEGALVFLAPQQVIHFDEQVEEQDEQGWTIIFHPDLIRKSTLGQQIQEYSFFDYHLNESLHLSDQEQQTLSNLVVGIEMELERHIDRHSQELIVSNLDTLLKYALRFYERQFFMRRDTHQDLVARFEQYLKGYFESEAVLEKGLPTLKSCGEALHISGSYLSDLLRTETGQSARSHIHSFVIDKAKTKLAHSEDSVGEIAYSLGFSSAPHFTKLFKSKTGLKPTEFRRQH